MKWQNLNEICTTCTICFTGMSPQKSFLGLNNCLKWLFPVFYPVPVLTLFNCVPTLPTHCLLSKKSFTKPETVHTEERRHNSRLSQVQDLSWPHIIPDQCND